MTLPFQTTKSLSECRHICCRINKQCCGCCRISLIGGTFASVQRKGGPPVDTLFMHECLFAGPASGNLPQPDPEEPEV